MQFITDSLYCICFSICSDDLIKSGLSLINWSNSSNSSGMASPLNFLATRFQYLFWDISGSSSYGQIKRVFTPKGNGYLIQRSFWNIILNRLANLSQCYSHLIFYSFNGKIEQFCHLPVLQAVFFYQLKDHLAFWWQVLDGFANAMEHFSSDHQLFGI